MFGLCDCNNFFVSCERVFNPSLNGIPVVVLSNNDGCIIARSNEAKALGIKMGTPLYQIKDLIKTNNVKIFSSNYQLYGDMSNRVMQTLKSLSPSIEIYSIDEAFINFYGFDINDLQEKGQSIAKIIKQNTGIPVSIGIAPTKTLAKIASKLCKKYPKLNGCCLMYKEQDILKVLNKYAIEDIWGIGRRYSKMLKGFNINTAQDFYSLSGNWVKAQMGVVGLRTWRELHSEPCIQFTDNNVDKQSICVSRSFAKEIYDYQQLNSAISTFTAMVAEKLRKQNSCAGEIITFIFTNRHRPEQIQSYESNIIKFEVATCSSLELIEASTKLLKSIFRPGLGYKKAGVIVSNIVSSNAIQYSLFDLVDRTKQYKLMQTLDTLNNQHGRGTITIGNQIANNLAVNRNHLSKCFTTKWEDILEINI